MIFKFTLVRRYIPPKAEKNTSLGMAARGVGSPKKCQCCTEVSLLKFENLKSGRWQMLQEALVHSVFLQYPKFKTTFDPSRLGP